LNYSARPRLDGSSSQIFRCGTRDQRTADFGDNFWDRGPAVDELSRVVEPSVPVRENHVDIGAAAKLLMSISIGNRFLIDAAAVVIRSVPDTALAVGVPAVVKPRELSA
jgi:serine O-acetyltransferase